jgi:hypothetical protein
LVLAYTAELEEWKRSRDSDTALPAPLRRWRQVVTRKVFLVSLALALAISIALLWSRDENPAAYRVADGAFVILNDHGRELWRKAFPGLGQFPSPGMAWVGDLDDDRKSEVLIAAPAPMGEARELVCYSGNGRERWRFVPGRAVHTATRSFSPAFVVKEFIVERLERTGPPRIVVIGTHQLEYPCQLAIISSRGELMREYWHSGHLSHVEAVDLDGDRQAELLAAGISKAYKTATLLVFDPNSLDGASLEEDAAYQLQGFRAGTERARVLFPRSCLSRREPFTNVERVWHEPGEIDIEVDHALGEGNASVYYRLNYDLTLEDVSLASSFEHTHGILHSEGILDHSLGDRDIAELRAIRYLKGPLTR